jgi:hypothetical protein
LVDDVLDRLESVALGLFPAWLPDAEVITASSAVDRRVVRQLAYRHAAGSEHFGPFLADLAEAAVRGVTPDRRFGPEVRANALARIIADSYHRTGVVLLVRPVDKLAGDQQRAVAVACEWLVSHGAIGVWLTPSVLPLVDRYPTWQLSVPRFVATLSAKLPPRCRQNSTTRRWPADHIPPALPSRPWSDAWPNATGPPVGPGIRSTSVTLSRPQYE